MLLLHSQSYFLVDCRGLVNVNNQVFIKVRIKNIQKCIYFWLSFSEWDLRFARFSLVYLKIDRIE